MIERIELGLSAVELRYDGEDVKYIELHLPAPLTGDLPVMSRPCKPLTQAVCDYLRGERREFGEFGDLVSRNGSEFDVHIWTALARIGYGSVVSYGRLAAMAGAPKAARAAGGACGRNPLPIVVPCHRIVAAGNKLGGFGAEPRWKKFLLDLEGVSLKGQQ